MLYHFRHIGKRLDNRHGLCAEVQLSNPTLAGLRIANCVQAGGRILHTQTLEGVKIITLQDPSPQTENKQTKLAKAFRRI